MAGLFIVFFTQTFPVTLSIFTIFENTCTRDQRSAQTDSIPVKTKDYAAVPL